MIEMLALAIVTAFGLGLLVGTALGALLCDSRVVVIYPPTEPQEAKT